MDKSKAKKAVKKSTARKQKADSAAQGQLDMLGMLPVGAALVNPEVQKGGMSDMQPPDGLLNPYRPTGAIAPTAYTPGNLLPGYNAPYFVNP